MAQGNKLNRKACARLCRVFFIFGVNLSEQPLCRFIYYQTITAGSNQQGRAERSGKLYFIFIVLFAPKKGAHCFSLIYFFGSLAEFILETSNTSRRIIRQTDNSSKYKSEEEFCSIICLDILSGKRPREKGNIAKTQKPVPPTWKLRQKTVYIPSRYKFRDVFMTC